MVNNCTVCRAAVCEKQLDSNALGCVYVRCITMRGRMRSVFVWWVVLTGPLRGMVECTWCVMVCGVVVVCGTVLYVAVYCVVVCCGVMWCDVVCRDVSLLVVLWRGMMMGVVV